MKPGAANHLPAAQIADGSSAGGGVAPPPALLAYASAEPTFLVSLPTRPGLIFAALVLPALLALAGWGVPNRDRVRTFAGAGAAVFGAAALSCCAVGYRRDRRPAARTSRIRPWALAACLILGAAGTTLGGGAVLVHATAKRTYHCYSSRHHCQRNLRQVAIAILLYAHQNNGRLPDTLDDVLRAGEVTSDVLICPVQAANPPRGGTIPYVYLGQGMKNDVGPDVVVLHDRPIDHGDGMNFGYGAGHVEWHDLEQSKKILAELNAGHNPPRPEKLK